MILGFIGLKLVLHFAHLHADAVPEVSTGVSLAVIVVVLGATTLASLIKSRRDPTARAHAGALRKPGTGRDKAAQSGSGGVGRLRFDEAARSRRHHVPAQVCIEGLQASGIGGRCAISDVPIRSDEQGT